MYLKLLLIILSITCNNCAGQSLMRLNTPKCKINYVLDISGGVFNHTTGHMIHEGIVYTPKHYFKHEGILLGCACDIQVCIPKCCEETTPGNIKCDAGYSPDLNVTVHHENLTLFEENAKHLSVFWQPCDEFVSFDESDTHFVTRDGRLFMDRFLSMEEYCFEREGNETHGEVTGRLCYTESAFINDEINKYAMLISVPFFFATLVVYFLIPNKKLQTKCLMGYISCMLLAYIILFCLKVKQDFSPTPCVVLGSCGIYFFLASFCWMNVTCIDMYLTFSGRRAPLQGNSAKWKQFGIYVCFANGTPLIILAIIHGINSMEPFHGHPNLTGKNHCWLDFGLPQLLYFYLPMAILLVTNMILFIFTALKIHISIRDNKKTLRGNESQRHCESNKQDYVMYIKLFIAMGINWILELISWIVNWCIGDEIVAWIWYPTDFCNAIYGIFIFIIFVCKKAVWIKLKQRYYIFMGQPQRARVLSSGYQISQTERSNMDDTCVSNNCGQVRLAQM